MEQRVEKEGKNRNATEKGLKKRRRKRKIRRRIVDTHKVHLCSDVPEGVSPCITKYWYQRYNLFSRYDEGIEMDEEGWFSVTPEDIAIRHAEKSGNGLVIDCFSGVGGNAIQFAHLLKVAMLCFSVPMLLQWCCHVIAIDINARKVGYSLNNARIYGVEDYIDFIIGDFFLLAPLLKADVLFLSPPWGGPSYIAAEKFSLQMLKPKDGYSLFQVAQKTTPNIIMFLPRNVDVNQVEELSWLSSPPLEVEIEENYVKGKLKGITAYFGDIAYG
ncbi:trimethylguanosine synthase isoform X2 [Amborella trichopoda]|uniref:trimethylguanosine synthase isoform X2 n=1 Tax=Amborella trichopoda TaxID=13333 RepID=UPI0009BEA3CC|nr:trimethylguanosine synthase isoform X2 [Amborella trichopoda]|eukprot:XP_020523795.1 trimethylguanosine synthase isoform X2 [Amborella trichopoda]